MPEVVIRSTENGPNLVVVDGKVVKAYCRCGGSSNKPFCDGTHTLRAASNHTRTKSKSSNRPISTRRNASLEYPSNPYSHRDCCLDMRSEMYPTFEQVFMDEQTTIAALRKRVSNFRDERDWLKDNTPKNLAISISVEAAELLEHFQWKNDEQIRQAVKDRAKKNKVSDELADVLILCLGFSDVVGIDISEAVEGKLRKAAEKYPVTKIQLRAKP